MYYIYFECDNVKIYSVNLSKGFESNHYWKPFEIHFSSISFIGDILTQNVTGLVANSKYKFFVLATNAAGDGKRSDPFIADLGNYQNAVNDILENPLMLSTFHEAREEAFFADPTAGTQRCFNVI